MKKRKITVNKNDRLHYCLFCFFSSKRKRPLYPHVNEGPQPLIHDGRVFIIFSASGSWTDDYCLGQLTYLGGDPLAPESWRKEPAPVFKKTETIFAPGHCSFVKDKSGQDWIIYHAARSGGAGWARQIRAKQFGWKADGSPDFGQPL